MSDRYLEVYRSLEPISEEEVEMLFPEAIGNGEGWIWRPYTVRTFGISDENVLHLFARHSGKNTFHLFLRTDVFHIDDYNWMHYVWKEKWEFCPI